MSARRRSGRGKGGGGNAGGNNNGGGGPSGGAPKGGQGGGGKPKAKKVVDFWDVPAAAPLDLAAVRVPDDPTVLVRSLGAPALPGQGANAEHYFTAVYDKASHVAYALAVANGLLADEDHPSGTAGDTSDTGGASGGEGDDAEGPDEG